jgi:hypothetical protein
VTPEPWLFTSRFAEPALQFFGGALIRTTVYPPRFKLRYTLHGTIAELAPKGIFGQPLTDEQFTAAYRARLDSFGIEHILWRLEEARSLTPSGRVCTLCFENLAQKPCHRRAMAAWLFDRTEGQRVVPELDPADWIPNLFKEVLQ